jgi:hypothetical protein
MMMLIIIYLDLSTCQVFHTYVEIPSNSSMRYSHFMNKENEAYASEVI